MFTAIKFNLNPYLYEVLWLDVASNKMIHYTGINKVVQDPVDFFMPGGIFGHSKCSIHPVMIFVLDGAFYALISNCTCSQIRGPHEMVGIHTCWQSEDSLPGSSLQGRDTLLLNIDISLRNNLVSILFTSPSNNLSSMILGS